LEKAPAKLLLFGEYTVMSGGSALAMPLSQFGGQWTDLVPPNGQSLQKAQGRLHQLANHESLRRLAWLDLAALERDLDRGRWIKSDIPAGYGLGSSGMVTALIYGNYATDKADSIIELRSHLATIESFFHGTSSGIDPLTCYTNRRLLIGAPNDPITALPDIPLPKGIHLYLLDSGRKRNTAQLVERFAAQKVNSIDERMELGELKKLTELVLLGYLGEAGYQKSFFEHLRQLSAQQLQYFGHPFIPPDISEVWTDGLHLGHYYMKLCGAGGGGFFQVWSTQPLGHTLGEFSLVEIL
jgi:mevalonate kinase